MVDLIVLRLETLGCCLLLLTLSGISAARQQLGDPIDCVQHSAVGGSKDPGDEALDTYCWIKGTITILTEGKTSGPYPGVQSSVQFRNGTVDDVVIKRHVYYQWVPLALMLQVEFYVLVPWRGVCFVTKYSDACGVHRKHMGYWASIINRRVARMNSSRLDEKSV